MGRIPEQQAAEQHGDRVRPGRHRDQPGRQQRVGGDLHGAVGGDLAHEDLRARAAGRGRPGHLHAHPPQRRARNGGHGGGRHPAGRAAEAPDCDLDLRRDRRLSVRPDQGEQRLPPGSPIVFCEIPQLGPGRGPRDHDRGHAGARQRRHPGGQPRALEQHPANHRGLQLRARLRQQRRLWSRSRRAPWTSGSRRASSARRPSMSATSPRSGSWRRTPARSPRRTWWSTDTLPAGLEPVELSTGLRARPART